jgi:hypothetical protein
MQPAPPRQIDPGLVAEMRQIENVKPIELTISAQKAIMLCQILQADVALKEEENNAEASCSVASRVYAELYAYLCGTAPKLAAWLQSLEDEGRACEICPVDEIWFEAYPDELP